MIHLMQAIASAIAPLFRSRHQLVLLGELFIAAQAPLTIGQLAERTGISQATVSRQVSRLRRHGIVTVRALGRNRLVEANRVLPWYRELRNLLVQTIGPPALLASALARCEGISEAYVFGSWADRYHGRPGPLPNDIDLLVVGDPDAGAVYRACREVEAALRVDVNPVLVTPAEWAATNGPSGFLSEVRRRPLLKVPLPMVPAA